MIKFLNLGLLLIVLLACSPKEEFEYRTTNPKGDNDPKIEGSSLQNPFALKNFDPTLISIGDIVDAQPESHFLDQQRYLSKNFAFFYGNYRIWKSKIPVTAKVDCGNNLQLNSSLQLGESFRYMDLLPLQLFLRRDAEIPCDIEFKLEAEEKDDILLKKSIKIVNEDSKRIDGNLVQSEFIDSDHLGKVMELEINKSWSSISEFRVVCSDFQKSIKTENLLLLEDFIIDLKQSLNSLRYMSFCRLLSVTKDSGLIHYPIYQLRPKAELDFQFKMSTQAVGDLAWTYSFYLIVENRSEVNVDLFVPAEFSELWRYGPQGQKIEGGLLKSFGEYESKRQFKKVSLLGTERVEIYLNYQAVLGETHNTCLGFCDIHIYIKNQLEIISYVASNIPTGRARLSLGKNSLKFKFTDFVPRILKTRDSLIHSHSWDLQ